MRLLAQLLLASFCLGIASTSQAPSPFHKDNEYVFQYNAQICSGLISPNIEDTANAQQKAVTRIQAQAKITFTSDRHAELRLKQTRFGQLNELLEEPEKVQPMAIFEPKQIPTEKEGQLELPLQFSYAEGVIERVQFHADDQTWSKNVKRAVLNMLQLNLKRNNAQGLRAADEQLDDEEDQRSGQLLKLGKAFTIPEISLEGVCQTTYAINKAGKQEEEAFNVTKTINFKQCSKIADVGYGFQKQQAQPHCAQCQMYWSKKDRKEQQQTEQQHPGEQHPCNKCDPREVKEQTLDRSTVFRYQLTCPSGSCDSQKYALKQTELLSQYVYKQAKTQNGNYGSAMETVVVATLKFRSSGPKSDESLSTSGNKEESLLFSNQWEKDVKRFFMFGSEQFPESGSSSPFHSVPKVQQAEQALRKLAQTLTGDKQKGIEVQAGIEVQRLVELLQMCTEEELKRIEQNGIISGPTATQLNPEEKQRAKNIFHDALAICGTRNCIQKLAEKIQNKEITETKAVQALKTLTQLPAPSDQIVKIVQQLCKQEDVHSQKQLKQNCWLTFGALINELCQHNTQKDSQQFSFGAQSGFDKQEQCPMDKKQEYKETILDLFKSAASIYDKMLALTTLGNAGIDIAVGDIEQIANDPTETHVVRCKAIDALRRLNNYMPRKIQQILLPIFQNGREQPEVRATAFDILLSTHPGPAVVDQLVYTISKEANRQVQAFAYRQMKALTRSKNPIEQEMARHIKNALKLGMVDEQTLRNSGQWQVPVYSEQHQEGLFIKLAQFVSSRSSIPAYLHAQIDSFVNDQFQSGQVKLFMMQQGAEDWYKQTMSSQFGKTRADRQSSEYSQSLRDIHSALGIKRRQSSSNDFDQHQESDQSRQENQQLFAMLCLRVGDVDQAFVAIEGNNVQEMPKVFSQIFGGSSKLNLAHLFNIFTQDPQQAQQQQQIRGTIVTNLNEQQAKIPTSAGVPLRFLTSSPLLATMEGHVHMNAESNQLEPKLDVNLRVMGSFVHMQKMECRLPFLVSGVESIRSIEANVPLQAELSANPSQGPLLRVKMPAQKNTLLGLHSLPFTYTADVDSKTKLVHEPRQVRAIHQVKLERLQHDVDRNCKAAEQIGIPLNIQGHYHWPAQPTSYQQFFQMLMATENILHITYQPNEESPREALFRISGTQFQKISDQMPQLQDFYSQRIESAFDGQELEDMQIESANQRKQKLQNFLASYQPTQQYKHGLKISAQTVGGSKEFKFWTEVAAICDAKMQACSAQFETERSPLGGENQKWNLKAQAQLAMPETVQSQSEIAQLEQRKNNKLQCRVQTEWGANEKQHLNIRLQGEQAKKRDGRNQENEQKKWQIERSQAFLNKFDLEVQYQLKSEASNVFGRLLEWIKSTYYWNSHSQLILNGQNSGNGKVLASLIIDPTTHRHANASIKTPNQVVRLQQFQLPTQFRPFPLVRQQRQSTNSIGQFINRYQVQGRAECTVDGRRVNTFDNVEYSAPLSPSCYSILAKDCSSDEPQFVVMMKGQGIGQKIKVITPLREIECQSKPSAPASQQLKIVCKENGNQIQSEEDSDAVEFNNGQKSDVTVHVEGISVRFIVQKAWLKVSSLFKNGQCGLCGHYDDSEQNEWRMGNNQNTDDLAKFHRSYLLKGNGQGERCEEEEVNNFYQQHGSKIRKNQGNQYQVQEEDEEEDEQEEWKNEQFDGQWKKQADWEEDQEEEWQVQEQQQRRGGRIETAVKRTKVLEMNHQICFSQESLKQCPKGSVPIYPDQQQERKNVHFSCFIRSSPDAVRLLRQVRNRNPVVHVPNRGTSMVEKISEPKKCLRNR